MLWRIRSTRSLVAVCVLVAGVFAGAAPVGAAHQDTTVLLSDLTSPKGLALAPNGDLLVGQGAFGPPGPILLHDLDGPGTEEITAPVSVVDVAAGKGQGWALTGGSEDGVAEGGATLYRFDGSGALTAVADIAAYQAGDPDPFDNEDVPAESNPYGLASLPSGDALVVDAANNDLLRITPGGNITTVARFDTELIKTDHLPREFGLPPRIPAESVPTSISVGSDGFVYVGELKGFPFRPKSSRIWRINPEAEGAVCSATTPDPNCRTAAKGFTAIQDIAVDVANRKLYVYELAEGGVFAFESGFETFSFPPAVLLEVTGSGQRSELAPGELSEPGGLVVDGGDIYVTDGIFTGGRLLKVPGSHPVP